MRTPAVIAKTLDWLEACRGPNQVHYRLPTVPAPVPADGPVSMHLEQPPALRLHVCKVVGPEHAGRYRWVWRVVGQDRNTIALDAGRCRTQPEALVVGLAALDAAHARTRR